MTKDIDLEDLKKISSLIHHKYGYDFSKYAQSSFKRRISRVLDLKNLRIDSLLAKLDEQPHFVEEFLNLLTVNVTEMFRDPGYWRAMRDTIIPGLIAEKATLNVWHAGCSSGEEVLSMAILLKEMGILHQVDITATDIDLAILEKAKSATYFLKTMEVNCKNYDRFGGAGVLGSYYHEENGCAVFSKDLLENVSFKRHDLVTKDIEQQFDLIICRNVMIYFNQKLQNDVLKKFHSSLALNGYLGIGSKESLIWCDVVDRFTLVNQEEKIYRKTKE